MHERYTVYLVVQLTRRTHSFSGIAATENPSERGKLITDGDCSPLSTTDLVPLK